MNKKRVNFVKAILCFVIAVCLFGGIGTIKTVSSAELVTSTKWSNPTTENLTASEDTETGYTHFSGLNAWGRRMYYNEKLTLDGLTVKIGSNNQVKDQRFGFGFTSEAGQYTLEGITTVNVNWVPSQWDGQNRLYVTKNHDIFTTPTICYKDTGLTNGTNPFGLDTSFVATATADDVYSFTFALAVDNALNSKDVWAVTIDVIQGTKFSTQTTPCTVYFSGSYLSSILDANGQCYLSAWGIETAGDFYIGVVTAEEKALLNAADSALATYETARKSNSSAVNERGAALDAVKNVPELYKAEYQAKLTAIDAIDSNWTVAWNTDPATYDVATGFSTVNPKAWGDRIYYNQKVQLDGLQVTFGAYSQTSKARYGFGLISGALDNQKHSVIELSTLNIYAYYEPYATGRTDLFVYDSSDLANGVGTETTVAYMDSSLSEKGVYKLGGNANNSLVTGQSSSGANAYVMTFNKVNDTVWSIKIDIITGNGWDGINSVTVYISSSVLANAIDSNGDCYISAWGMDNAAPFCMEVKESSLNTLIANAEEAKAAYKAAIASGEGEAEAEAAYISAIEKLPANESVKQAVELEKLQAQEEALKNITHSASVTVSDSLSLNYKIDVPVGVEIARTVLTSEVCGETETYEGGTIDDQGKYVVKTQNITPQNLTEVAKLHFVAYDADGNAVVQRDVEYSIQEYCQTLIESTSDKKLRTALVDLLNYGAEAQKYVNKDTANLANADISKYQGMATQFNAGIESVLSASNGSVVTFKSATLSLEDKVAVHAKFTTTVDVSSLTAKVKIGSGSEQDFPILEGANGVYYVILPGVSPLNYADNIVFSIYYNGAVNAECTYSVNSYIARMHSNASCGAIVKALYSYGVGVSAYHAVVSDTSTESVISDALYQNGLKIQSPDGSSSTTATTVNQGATPTWIVSQWGSDGQLTNTKEENGVFTYWDAAKTLSIDTNTGAIGMSVLGSVEYPTQDRQTIDEQWPHLLMQQDYYGDDLIRLSSMSAVRMQMTYTVTECIDKMHGKVDADNLHCAQFVWYISLQNRTEGHADYGKYMWFGMILFDNRFPGATYGRTNKTADNSDQFIYQPGTADWSPTGKMPAVGERMIIDYDILEVARIAYNEATKWSRWNQVFSSTTWEDLYVGTMNFGIELPGTYDISIEIEDVGVRATPKA